MHLKEKVKGESPYTALEYAPEKPDAPSVDGEVRIYVVEEANELLGAQECTVKAFLAFVLRGADSKDAKYFADPDDDSVLEDFVSDSEGRYLDNGGSLLDSRYLAPADGQEEEGTTLLLMAGEVPSGVLKNSEPVSGAPGLAVARLARRPPAVRCAGPAHLRSLDVPKVAEALVDRQLDVLPSLWIAEFRPQLASVHIREPGTAVEKSGGGSRAPRPAMRWCSRTFCGGVVEGACCTVPGRRRCGHRVRGAIARRACRRGRSPAALEATI